MSHIGLQINYYNNRSDDKLGECVYASVRCSLTIIHCASGFGSVDDDDADADVEIAEESSVAYRCCFCFCMTMPVSWSK